MGGWHDLPNSHEAKLVGGKTVHDKPELARMTNPITYINDENKAIPFLIVHGEEDKVVPVSQAGILYNELSNATILYVKGANHGMEEGNITIDTLLYMILSFFNQYLRKIEI